MSNAIAYVTLAILVFCSATVYASEPVVPIDRQAVVRRHNVVIDRFDPLTPLIVGNGEFAFGVDVTGLQTFPEAYEEKTPLCTLAQWGWHSFPMPAGMDPSKYRYAEWDTYGRKVGYATSKEGQEPLFNYLRDNPHRLHLGRVGLELRKKDGGKVSVEDIKNIRQELDLWTGVVTSTFELEGVPVKVVTSSLGEADGIAVEVESPLVAEGRCSVVVAFPYGSPKGHAADWASPDRHTTTMRVEGARADFARKLDGDAYAARVVMDEGASIREAEKHRYVIESKGNRIAFTVQFAPREIQGDVSAAQGREQGARFWDAFWRSGGAIDLAGSTDPRSKELERRIVLSQYVTRVNCAGSLPPAETGLTCNSWNGKFHLEMHWWHAVHFAAWGRQDLLERSLPYYRKILPEARAIARRQGYDGARWPKMVGPDGKDSPSPIGPLLIWQQPHPIYYAELVYRAKPSTETLEAWREVIDQTADFMASFPVKDASGRYALGPPLKTVPEHTEAHTTKNAIFELAYWRFGLRTAIEWRKRLGVAPNPKWVEVLENLAPLPQSDGYYLTEEGTLDTYTKWNWEHPALAGVLGVLPGDGADPAVARRTVERVMTAWKWDDCWGWDFPMMAMGAARVGRPDLAVDALLMDVPKNTYLKNGNNYQRPNLPLYLPGNGGLLTAVAMMASGWDGAPNDARAPGFPKEGWNVKYEGFRRLP